jgi:membrane fusion protein, multidrug efflux system
MKSLWKKILLGLTAVAVIGGLIFAFNQGRKELASEAQADRPVASPSKVETGTNGETVVTLDENAQKLIGLETAKLTNSELPREVNAYGQVLDPTPLVGLLSDTASLRASLAASSKDYERSKTLFDQGQNASAKALETIEATMKRDGIALKAAEVQLLSAWGKGVANQPDLPSFVQSLAARETALVRLDLPTGDLLEQIPTGGRVIPSDKSQPVEAQFLGRAATTDRQVQGDSFLFVVTNIPVVLTPGLSIAGFLQLPGNPVRGVIVPDAAVVRSAEHSWAYVQTGNTSFARREIALDYPANGGWLVTNGITSNDRVVVTGAQMLLSEERKQDIKPAD